MGRHKTLIVSLLTLPFPLTPRVYQIPEVNSLVINITG